MRPFSHWTPGDRGGWIATSEVTSSCPSLWGSGGSAVRLRTELTRQGIPVTCSLTLLLTPSQLLLWPRACVRACVRGGEGAQGLARAGQARRPQLHPQPLPGLWWQECGGVAHLTGTPWPVRAPGAPTIGLSSSSPALGTIRSITDLTFFFKSTSRS